MRVRSILIHNNYISATHENDIALVRLENSVTFTRDIHSVCLPAATQNIPLGSTAYVTGWGAQEYAGKCLRKKLTIEMSYICYYVIF